MQTAKSTGMGIGCLQHLVDPDADTGIVFSAAGSATTHLGIPLSTDPDAAARTPNTIILQRLDRRIARWSGFRLSILGRAHVFFVYDFVEEGLHVRRCQSYQHSERQTKQTTGECRVHSTSHDKGSRFAMA